MELRIEKASVALGSFLEEELALPTLGLPDSAAKHVERFRSFLHSFYVQRHGYWPPVILEPTRHGDRARALPKHLLLTMYADFRNLYEFIADQRATTDAPAGSDALHGGISALAAVGAFDRANRFAPLPHQLPRLPAGPWLSVPLPSAMGSGFAASARTLFTQRRGALRVNRAAAAQAFSHASNARDTKVSRARIVREFALFERECALHDAGADRTSPAEARKARWILVYAALQTLASVTRAPDEVRDAQGVEYPLCCQTAGTPPWKFVRSAKGTTGSASESSMSLPLRVSAGATSSDEDSATTVSPASTPDSAAVPPLDLRRVSHQRKRNSLIAAPRAVPPRSTSVPPGSRTTPTPTATADPLPALPSATVTFAALIADIQRGPLPQTATSPPRHAPLSSPPLSPPPRTRDFSRLTPSPAAATPTPTPTPPPALREPSLARNLATAAGGPVRCPVPTKPTSPRATDALLRNLDPLTTTAAHTPFPVRAGAGAGASADDAASEHGSTPTLSSAGGESSGDDRGFEPETPTTWGGSRRGARDDMGAAPSPSVYPDDERVGGGGRPGTPATPRTPTTPGAGPGKHKRDRSSELARKWREEIRWREGPGWGGDIEEILMGDA